MTARGKAGMKPSVCGWSLGQDWEQEAKTKLASVGPVTLRVDGHWVVGLGTRKDPWAGLREGAAGWAAHFWLDQAWVVARGRDSHGGRSQAGTRL